MSWLYRLFKRNVATTVITVDPTVTSGITVPALTVTGTTTQTGVATFGVPPVVVGTKGTLAAGASPSSYQVMTIGGPGAATLGATAVIWTLHGPPSPVGPTPTYIGSILIDTLNGKMYIASAVSAYTDWKLVTSA
jgi:hypothetical protein